MSFVGGIWSAVSGGGGTPPATMADEVREPFQLLLYGLENKEWGSVGSTFDWTSQPYKENPSILRWIHDYGVDPNGGNPYTGMTDYDPSSDISDYEGELSELQTFLDGLSPAADIDGFWTAALETGSDAVASFDPGALVAAIVSQAQGRVSSVVQAALVAAAQADLDSIVDTALANFRARQLAEHEIVVNRFEGAMSDINAVNSTAFVTGLAVLESNYEDRLAQYDAEFTLPLTREAFQAFMKAFQAVAQERLEAELNKEQARVTATSEAAKMMVSEQETQTRLHDANVRLSMTAARAKYMLKSTNIARNIEYELHNTVWDADVLQRGANLLSAINGSVVATNPQPSGAQQALSFGLDVAAIVTSILA